jgi:hypothetical protein
VQATYQNAATTLGKINGDRIEVGVVAKSIEDDDRDGDDGHKRIELDATRNEGTKEPELLCGTYRGHIVDRAKEVNRRRLRAWESKRTDQVGPQPSRG